MNVNLEWNNSTSVGFKDLFFQRQIKEGIKRKDDMRNPRNAEEGGVNQWRGSCCDVRGSGFECSHLCLLPLCGPQYVAKLWHLVSTFTKGRGCSKWGLKTLWSWSSDWLSCLLGAQIRTVVIGNKGTRLVLQSVG